MKYTGIGSVGLGSITRQHHAGYAHYGLPIVAGFDISPQARAAFAQNQPQAKVYDTLDALLNDPNVAFIDLATPHHRSSRLPVLEKIAKARKPVLIQKPLGMYYRDALEMVQMLEANGTVGMVNQNMCFTPAGLALPPLVVDQQVVGNPFFAHMELRMCFDCQPNHWFGKDERWWIIGLNVHHLSLLQLLFGPPEQVYAITGRDPMQPGVLHEGYGHLVLTYPSGLQVTFLSTGTYYGTQPKIHTKEEFWIQGPTGILDCTPEDGLTLSLRSDKDKPERDERTRAIATPGQWFPNAFGLVMAHLQQAVAAAAAPLCNVQDNLYVMAVMEAAYQSAASRRAVALAEIMGSRYQRDYGPGWLHGYRQWQPPVPVADRREAVYVRPAITVAPGTTPVAGGQATSAAAQAPTITVPPVAQRSTITSQTPSRLQWEPAGSFAANIVSDTGKCLGTYHWGQDRRHPFFHPLFSYGANQPLTNFAPWDHRWHKGLWWSWKYINGINFWEWFNDDGSGEGHSLVIAHEATPTAAGSIEIRQTVEMRVIQSNALLLVENRQVTLHPTVPGLQGGWAIDWDATTTAIVDCELKPTLLSEQPWGGYAGLNFRAGRSMSVNETLRNSNGASGIETCHRATARWAAYGGNVDGSEQDSAVNPAQAGVAIFDHPANLRHPTPFYAAVAGGNSLGFGFIGTAPIMYETLHLRAGQQLRFRHRVVLFDGIMSNALLDGLWQQWV